MIGRQCRFLPPKLAEIVGKPRVTDRDADLVQPPTNIFKAMPSREQIFDVRPCLPNLSDLRPWLLVQVGAQLTQIKSFTRIVVQWFSFCTPQEHRVVTGHFKKLTKTFGDLRRGPTTLQ